ncbi:MAG: glycosyltransferase [Bacteroidales bacterium]|jgi:glycosyltransferase involved in cell wall biosynthesis|nr:glycosyltransferase [Bacteroidales bacterium]
MLDWWKQQDVASQIILITFAATALFQILYFWIVFGKVAFYRKKKTTENNAPMRAFPAVSVVMVAQNDYSHLRRNLAAVLNQDYPDFEVLIVNSSSEETKSYYFLITMKEQYPNLKVVEIPEVRTFYSAKKFLLAIGTKEASNNIFLFTNPDCLIQSPHWIRTMMENMQKGKELALGYYGLADANKFYRLDHLNTSLNYLALARLGMPYTGSGNNMGYTRALFNKAEGFISHYSILYGEDTLFINKNANKKNTVAVLDQEAMVMLQPKISYKRWFRTKKEARMSQKQYKLGQRFVLSLFPFTRFVFFVAFILALYWLPINHFYYVVLGIFGIRLTSQLVVMKQVMKKFNEKKFLFLIPLFEPVNMLTSWWIFLKTNFDKKMK